MSSENFTKVNSDKLLEIMNICPDDQYIVLRDVLSSGAEVYITVKLPPQE
jgi:hypothetical protein